MTVPARAMRGSLLIAVGVLAADQLSKQWALSALDDRDNDLVWTLMLHH
jgi:hypothetical protein